ncbi:MAG: hypothetical protein ABI658_04025 [Acidimicrobiales bacterium]
MKRALAAVMALVFVVGACSGKKAESSGDPAHTSLGPSIETAAPGGELGSPILDGDDKGHYVPLKSSSSFEALKAGSVTATNQNGVLLAITNGTSGPFVVAMEDDAAKYLRVNKGWTVEEVGRDPSWRPIATAGVPHVAVGSGWVVALRASTADVGDDAREGVGTDVLIESYDTKGKNYYTTSAIDSSHSLFTNSLQVVDDHRFSFLFADGAVDGDRIPYIVRRTVDLTTFRFVDEAIDIGATNRMVNASALDDGYLVDLQRPKSERTGVFVRLEAGATDPTLQLTMKEAPAPTTVDGFKVEAAKPLALVGTTGAKTMLPADFASASVAGAVNNLVYLRYVASSAKAISADGLALVDVTRGTVTTAFDLTGTNRDATGPSADGLWANGSSRVLLLGVPSP